MDKKGAIKILEIIRKSLLENIEFVKSHINDDGDTVFEIDEKTFFATGSMIEAIDTEIKALENERPKSKWVIDENIDENGDYHCKNCKAIIEKDEWVRHNYYYCYHCGAIMRGSVCEK